MAHFVSLSPHPVSQVSSNFQPRRKANETRRLGVICLRAAFLLGMGVLFTSCGAAYHRDKFWNSTFGNSNGYEGYVVGMLNDTTASGWKTKYYNDLTTAGVTEDQKVADRNRVINSYLLLADVAYFKFSGGYNDQIANFEIGADMVNLGLTAASAVTPPSALLGAAATGSLGVQHSVEKNALNSQTRFVITNRMGAIRDRQRGVILRRELEPVSCPLPAAQSPNSSLIVSDQCYSLEDGMRDVNEYFNLGTINQALADISTTTEQIVQQNRATMPDKTKTTPAVITSQSTVDFTASTAGSFVVNTSGTPNPTLAEAGALPAGLHFSDNRDGTATISGTPATGSAGTYPLTITAHNGVGTDATQTLTLTVH